MAKKSHRIISLLLVVLLVTATLVTAIPTSSLEYIGVKAAYKSTDYTSGKYYTNLKKVNLTGDERYDIMKVVESQLGYHEGNSKYDLDGNNSKGNKNYTEYANWYGNGNNGHFAWCAAFVCWAAKMAGAEDKITKNSFVSKIYKGFLNKTTTAYDANGKKKTAKVVFEPQDVLNGSRVLQYGDIIFFSRPLHTNITGHIGFVESGQAVYDSKGKMTAYYVYVLEGNAENKVKRTKYNLLAKVPTDWTAGGTIDGYEYTPYVDKYKKNNDGKNDDPKSIYYHDYIGYFASPKYDGENYVADDRAGGIENKGYKVKVTATYATIYTSPLEDGANSVGRIFKNDVYGYASRFKVGSTWWYKLSNDGGYVCGKYVQDLAGKNSVSVKNSAIRVTYSSGTYRYKGPSKNYYSKYSSTKLKTGAVYNFTETLVNDGVPYYKLSTGGWVTGSQVEAVPSSSSTGLLYTTGTVKGYTSAGGSKTTGKSYKKNNIVAFTKTSVVKNVMWFYTANGWIKDSSVKSIFTTKESGYITSKSSSVTIRNFPAQTKKSTLKYGKKVQFVATTLYNNSVYYQLTDGNWIQGDYVKIC